KEVTPKPPGCGLSGDEERVSSFEVKKITNQSGDRRIRRKKSDIRYFHHLVTNGRHDRLEPAVDDIGEPIAVVLNQGRIAIGQGPFWGEQTNRHRDLRQSKHQSGNYWLKD